MGKTEYSLNKLNRGRPSIWWLICTMFFILILLLLLTFCKSGLNIFGNPNIKDKNPIANKPNFPSNPNRLLPIDTNKIIVIPDDPLQREIMSDRLNVYLSDSVDLKVFSQQVIKHYSKDSIKVNYFADEYKRIQFLVPDARRELLKKDIKSVFNEVKFVCFEAIYSQFRKGSDPGFKSQSTSWFYEQIGLYNAWDITKGNPKLIVAVIDDSFDPEHKEIKTQIVSPWNVTTYSNLLSTYGGQLYHGTHVAGSLVGIEGNGVGLSGVAPNCRLMPVQIADKNGSMTTSSILDGIFYAMKNKASVINLSLGQTGTIDDGMSVARQKELARTLYLDEAEMWDEVYQIAEKEGVIIVQAAGNSNVIAELDPMKRSLHTLVVGATNEKKQRTSFSNYGEDVGVYAPGQAIYSSMPNNKFSKLDGTSMSSPIVAGCVALMLSKKRSLTLSDIKALIARTGLRVNNEQARLIQIDKILEKL